MPFGINRIVASSGVPCILPPQREGTMRAILGVLLISACVGVLVVSCLPPHGHSSKVDAAVDAGAPVDMRPEVLGGGPDAPPNVPICPDCVTTP